MTLKDKPPESSPGKYVWRDKASDHLPSKLHLQQENISVLFCNWTFGKWTFGNWTFSNWALCNWTLKKLICKGTLRQVFICLKPRTPYSSPPPFRTINVYSTVYSTLIHTGKGEVEPKRRGEGNSSQSWAENTDMIDLQSINSDKHLPQSPFTGQFFR